MAECYYQNPSYHWNSILKGIESVKDDVCWYVGDGRSIRIGIDPFVHLAPMKIPTINPRFQVRK